MDNFEKRMWLKYAIKMVSDFDVDSWQFEEMYHVMKQKIGFKSISIKKSKRSEIKKTLKDLKKVFEDKYNSLTPQKTVTEEKFLYLKQIYNLDDIEYEYLLYYTLCEINKMFLKLEDCITDRSYNFGIEYLDLKVFEARAKSKGLVKSGIMNNDGYRNGPMYSPNYQILKAFESQTKISEIKNIILGDVKKSTLKWNDFAHLGKERDVTLKILKAAVKNKTKGVNILLYGAVGTGKTEFARLVAEKAKVSQYCVTSQCDEREATREMRMQDLYSKQNVLAIVDNTCILFDEAEDVMNRGFGENGRASKAYLNTALEETPVPVFWTTNDIMGVDPAFMRRMTLAIEFEKLTEDVRLKIWNKTVKNNDLKVNKAKLIELNKNYDLSPSLITNAVKATKLINGTQDDFELFVENVAKVVTKKKSVKNQKEFEMSDYNDSLVNADTDIIDLTNKIKSCGKLNFSLCLYGEPGTGKSLYARYLAKQIGVPVILKRASDLLNMYVGETEHLIAAAFAEAKSKGAMLIFDEADSFLQNRNNAVRSWQITQVNEMLTWMESHEYPFVCTTNLLDTLDEASLRRFTFKIKFDFLNKEQINSGIEHFFGIKNTNLNIKGLTAGDFATVKKKTDFLNITDINEIAKLLEDEVRVKKSKTLQKTVGF